MTTEAPASAPAGTAAGDAGAADEAARQTAAANAANAAANAAAAAAAPAPAPAPQAPAGVDENGQPWTLESAMAELAKVRNEAGRKRASSKNVVDALRVLAQDAGLEVPGDEPTVESLTASVGTISQERDQARGQASDALRQQVIAEEAWKAGVSPERAGYLGYLLQSDPQVGGTSVEASNLADFRATVSAKIGTLKGTDPVLQGAAGGGPGASGPSSFGGANGTTAITQEQFQAMDYDQRLELFNKNPEEYRRLSGA
jgi:hypothetical protein